MATLLNANGDLISMLVKNCRGKNGFLKSCSVNFNIVLCSITKSCFYFTITGIAVVNGILKPFFKHYIMYQLESLFFV
jgi:recombinational DNA repair protein (RecF pathway)